MPLFIKLKDELEKTSNNTFTIHSYYELSATGCHPEGMEHDDQGGIVKESTDPDFACDPRVNIRRGGTCHMQIFILFFYKFLQYFFQGGGKKVIYLIETSSEYHKVGDMRYQKRYIKAPGIYEAIEKFRKEVDEERGSPYIFSQISVDSVVSETEIM